MTGHLQNFLDFLVSENILKKARRENPELGFTRFAKATDYDARLARSYLIETRTAIVEQGKAEIWSIGSLARAKQSVVFEPKKSLATDIAQERLHFSDEVRRSFEFKFEPLQSHSGADLLEAVARRILEKKASSLEQVRGRRPRASRPRSATDDESLGERTMEAFWRTFGAAIHDQICRGHPIELETIGMFVPVATAEMVRFVADEHLLNLIAGQAAAASESRIRTRRHTAQMAREGPELAESDGQWSGFLDEERDLYPSDESPYEGLTRDAGKKPKKG